MKRTILPEWLTDILPEPGEPHVISLVDGNLVLTDPEGNAETFGDDLARLHDACRSVDVTFTDEVNEKFGGALGLTYPSGHNMSAMIISMTDATRLRLLENEFEYSLRCSLAYEADPGDFFASYQFVNSHAAFWSNHDIEHSPWFWETSNHCENISQYVFKENGKVSVGLETGAHVEPDYKHHYHDYRFDVYGDSFEDAFIQLAEQVHRFYYPDGSEKKDIDHVKPQWILDLEDRVKEIKENE